MNIGKKLVLGFLVVALIGASLGAVGVFNIWIIKNAQETQYHEDTLPLAYLIDAQGHFQKVRIFARDMLYSIDEGEARRAIDAVTAEISAFSQSAALLADAATGERVGLIAELLKDFGSYADDLSGIQAQLEVGELETPRSTALAQTETFALEVESHFSAVVASHKASSQQSARAGAELASSSSWVMVILAVLTTLGSALGGLLLSRSLSLPLRRAVDITEQVSKGDLSVRLDDKTKGRRDEVGNLGRAVDSMTRGLASRLRGVQSTSAELRQSGEQLGEQMEATALTLTGISRTIEGVNHHVLRQGQSVAETSAAVGRILASLETLDRLIETQAANVTESSASVEQMVSNLHAISGNVENMSAAFRELQTVADDGRSKLARVVEVIGQISEQSHRLQEANSTIRSIASQTNLLAMNAAIEAAHAGESGQGFGVVADEIRKLAEMAKFQSKEIAGDLKSIQQQILHATAGSTVSERSFQEVLAKIEVLGRFEQEIKAAMVEQSSGSEQMLEATTQIIAITSDVREGSMQMLQGGQSIDAEMKTLLLISGQLSQSMAQIATDTGAIDQAVEMGRTLSLRNGDLSLRLATEIQQYKLE